jgi:hypothetical protein
MHALWFPSLLRLVGFQSSLARLQVGACRSDLSRLFPDLGGSQAGGQQQG